MPMTGDNVKFDQFYQSGHMPGFMRGRNYMLNMVHFCRRFPMKFFPFFVSRIFVIACMIMVPGFASAEVEFKARGHWMWGFNVGNVHDQEHSADKDRFQAVQRLRTIFEFAASPQLGGAIQLEMGKTNWGQAHSGGAIGADSVLTKLRHAWLDWTIPRLDTRVRMGLQPVNMPSFVNGSPIFSEDTAAIVISQNFTENIENVFFWARASAANENPGANSLPPYNEMDFFGLAIPFSFDKIRFTPYGMFANVGINSIGSRQESGDEWVLSPYKSSLRAVAANLTPVGGPDILANPRRANQLEPWGSAWWGGIGGKLDFFEPFSLAAEVAWGHAGFGSATVDGRTFEMRRAGWYGAALAEYKLDWMVPGLLGWYSSGDDDDPWNGSERMPVGKSGNRNWKVLSLAYDGTPFCPDGGAMILSPNGTMIGTWGLVGRFRDMSFVENLSHTLRGGYIRGTNNPDMVTRNPLFTDTTPGGYLTYGDEAFEIDIETKYDIYENLSLVLDGAWLRVNWDKSVWDGINGNLEQNFLRLGFTAYYKF